MPLVDNAWYVDGSTASSVGYYAVTAWSTGVAKAAGAIVRQATTPAVGSERAFICYQSTGGAGVTGAVEPTWVITRGGQVLDNTVRWQEITGIAGINNDFTNSPIWTNASIKNTAIVLGQVIKSSDNTKILLATSSGTAGNGAEPTWSAFTTTGATTADNTVTWTTIGTSTNITNWGAPHPRLNNAFTANWGQAGNSFFVASEHAETQATANSLTAPGTTSSPNAVMCVAKTPVPPTASTTGATITTTGASLITLAANGYLYVYGIAFSSGSGAVATGFTISALWAYLKNCSISRPGSTTGNIILGAGANTLSSITFDNTTVQFGNTADGIAIRGTRFRWINTATAITGATLPTILFRDSTVTGSQVTCQGVDLSALASGKTLVTGMSAAMIFSFVDCKLGSTVTVASAPSAPGSDEVYVVRSDSGATNYRQEKYQYMGTQTVETTIVRTGGATDGTTPISWKVVTTANSKWVMPFECVPIRIWNDRVSTNLTITLYGTWPSGAVPNNDNIWFDVEYLGSSATPQGTFATATKADNLATGTALSSDTSTWGGSVTPFKMSITLSSPQPLQKGYLNIMPKSALASSTFYIDPRPLLS